MSLQINIQELFQSLRSDLKALDAERIQVKNSLARLNLIWPPLIGVVIVALLYFMANNIQVPAYLCGFGAVISYVAFSLKKNAIKKEFAQNFKSKVVRKILDKVDPSFSYDPARAMILRSDRTKNPIASRIYSSLLFPPYARCWIEDVIEGAAGSAPFQIAEIQIIDDDGKIFYSGVLATAFLQSSFPIPVYLLRASHKEEGRLSKAMGVARDHGKPVDLQDSDFERVFKTYSPDPVLARAILPAFVRERLLQIHNKISAINKTNENLEVAFFENTIVISIRLPFNLFDPTISKSVDDISYVTDNIQYLTLLISLIEDLNLNSRS